MAANSGQVFSFALTVMVMGLACAGIGIALYPVLKQHDKGLALAAMGFRLMEGPLQLLSAVGYVALLAVSREFVKAGSPPDSFYQPVGAAIKAVNEWMSMAFYLPFCIGAFSYYLVFFRTRLVPRWLSVWGLVGISLMSACRLDRHPRPDRCLLPGRHPALLSHPGAGTGPCRLAHRQGIRCSRSREVQAR